MGLQILWSFIALCLTFKSMINFELICIKWVSFLCLWISTSFSAICWKGYLSFHHLTAFASSSKISYLSLYRFIFGFSVLSCWSLCLFHHQSTVSWFLECRRIGAFELWFWRRFLRVPWTARRSSQSILKEISPGCCLEGLMLKLQLQYFGHFVRRFDSLEKTLMLGGVGGRRRRDDRGWDGWMASLTRWMWVWVNSGSWWWTERPGVLRFMGSQRVRHDWATDLIWSHASSSGAFRNSSPADAGA